MFQGLGGVGVIMALIKVIEHLAIPRIQKPNGKNGKCAMKPGDSEKIGEVHGIIHEKEEGTPLCYFPRRIVDDAHREQLGISRDIATRLAETSKSQENIVAGQSDLAEILSEIKNRKCPRGADDAE